jgi:predicted acetyltransferase
VQSQKLLERTVGEVLSAASPAPLERLTLDGRRVERPIAGGALHPRRSVAGSRCCETPPRAFSQSDDLAGDASVGLLAQSGKLWTISKMGRVSLTAVTAGERTVLENLVQLYCHDWSEMVPLDVDDDGRFQALALAPYRQDGRALLLRVDDKLAGFALILERSKLTGTSGVFDMAEFFVMRRYRRQGVGLAAAFAAFDRFKGPWEVRQHDENVAATAFWRRAIHDYTRGNYREVRWDGPEWTGVVQTFSTG